MTFDGSIVPIVLNISFDRYSSSSKCKFKSVWNYISDNLYEIREKEMK